MSSRRQRSTRKSYVSSFPVLVLLFLHSMHLFLGQKISFLKYERSISFRRSRTLNNLTNVPSGLSQRRQWHIFTTSKHSKNWSIRHKAFLFTIVVRILKALSLGVYLIKASASSSLKLRVNFSSKMFLQYFPIAEKRWWCLTMWVIVIDSRPPHDLIAISIPSFDRRPEPGRTSRLSCGVLQKHTHYIIFVK